MIIFAQTTSTTLVASPVVFFSARKGESPILEFSLAEEDLDSDTCALLYARNVAQAAVALKLPVKSHFGMGKSYIYV